MAAHGDDRLLRLLPLPLESLDSDAAAAGGRGSESIIAGVGAPAESDVVRSEAADGSLAAEDIIALPCSSQGCPPDYAKTRV